jgi:hypothetical protein
MRNLIFALTCLSLGVVTIARSEEELRPPAPPLPVAPPPQIASPVGTVPLNKNGSVLLDSKGKKLYLKSRVCLRQGVLEMLLCLKQTKEHESIVSLDSDAIVIHAGLLALGAKPGQPARLEGETYVPARGQKIEIFMNWLDEEGQPRRQRAQEWIRRVTHRYFAAPLASLPEGVVIDVGDDSLRYDPATKELLFYGSMSPEQQQAFLAMSSNPLYQQAVRKLFEQGVYQEMQAHWIFVGSGFSTLMDGTQWYQAQAGTVICVANFPDAMIDIDIESSGSNSALLYEPYTERIPPVGTTVLVELVPVQDE